ncbi:MAG: hypothetical protein Q9184_000736 [Pyrenodesmia sp. 2 TL-2023]
MSAQPKKVPRPQGQGKKPFRLASIRDPHPRPFPRAQAPPAKKRVPDRIQVCSVATCQSRDLDEENGHLVCQACGTVLQETNIVSDNMFIDGPGGEALRAGVTVSNDSARPRNYDAMATRIVGGMSSREVSEANGKKIHGSRRGTHVLTWEQDTAMQVYKLCLANNFVQGRVTRSVAAVCLYIACRRSKENNKFMLIDFADKCNINVFKLGTIFKDLLDVLHIRSSAFQSLEPINIESLILRFAEQMNFGRMKQRIANEAVRIVQRMSRDWMTDGRRPAGICGAALILAARMNNFRRVVREVVYTVKVAEQTILNRLHEFSQTASSGLTVEEFRTKDLEHAEDPPAWRNKDKVKKRRKCGGKQKGHVEKKKARVNDNDAGDDSDSSESGTSRATSTTPSNANNQPQTLANTQAERDRRNMPPPPVPIDPALLQVSKQRLAELPASPSSSSAAPTPPKRGRGRPPGKTKPPPEPTNQDLQIEAQLEADIQNILDNEANIESARTVHENPDAPGMQAAPSLAPALPTPPSTQASAVPAESAHASSPSRTEEQTESPVLAPSQARTRRTPSLGRRRSPPPSRSRSSSLSSAPSSSSSSPSSSPSRSPTPLATTFKPNQQITRDSTTQPLLDLIPSTEIIPDAEFASDPEIASCLLTAPEIAIKERIWVHENSAYLRAQQSKLLKQHLAEQNGTARVIVRRKRKRTRIGDLSGIYGEEGEAEGGEEGGIGRPKDAAEAVERMMKKRGFSKKINYGVIGSAYSSEKGGSEAGGSSRRSSLAPQPETSLSPDGRIVVNAAPQAVAGAKERIGGREDEPIEVVDEGESELDEYYSEDEMEMEMAGVDAVLGRLDSDEEEDEDEE